MTRILIADDHEMFRELLRLACRAQSDFEIVAEAGDGAQVLELVERTRPDVVLLDYRMPYRGTFANLVGELRRRCPVAQVVVLSGFASADIARHAAEGGASGYVLKRTRVSAVFEAVRAVRAGGVWIDPALPRKAFDAFRDRPTAANELAPGMASLTRREHEVLSCVAAGSSNRDIASKLSVSEQTVKTHLTRIFAKLAVQNRVAAALAFYGRSALPSAAASLRAEAAEADPS